MTYFEKLRLSYFENSKMSCKCDRDRERCSVERRYTNQTTLSDSAQS
jgi:hypothetical protein